MFLAGEIEQNNHRTLPFVERGSESLQSAEFRGIELPAVPEPKGNLPRKF